MEHLWAPVGTGVRPQEETDFVVVSLFGDRSGLAAAREMDATIGQLPGFAGSRILERALAEAMQRGRTSPDRRTSAMPIAALR
jgi:hypothetical protein